MDSLLLDCRFALRSLLRRKPFAVVALVTIAVSIGAATSIFSVVDGVLFRSLPYHDPSRLIAVWQTIPDWRKEPILADTWDHVVVAYDDFEHWRERQTSFTAVGAWSGRTMMLSSVNGPEQVQGTRASPSLFDALGVKAILGRTFLPGEDALHGPHVALISYGAWEARFGGRRDVVGSTIGFDSIPYQIVGVLPKEFTLIRGQEPTPFFVPAGQDESDRNHNNHSYRAIGRLKAGVTMEQASTEADRLLGGPEARPQRGIRLLEYQTDQSRAVRAPLLILLGAVGVLMLVACVNVATLLLGEAASREHEMGARVALGATRGRLVRQLLTESVLLSVSGAALGVILAWWMTKGLIAIAPARIPGIQTARVDGRIVAAAAAAAAITGILFGLIPALTLAGSGPAALLRSGGQSVRGRARLQRFMIGTELALAVVLLVGAGLLSRSLQKLAAVDPGFRADHLLTVRLAFPRGSFSDEPAYRARYDAIMQRVAALPGVVGVTGGSPAPFDGGTSSSFIRDEHATGDPFADPLKREAQQKVIVPNFFSTLGIPVLAGRAFTPDDRDGAPRVAIVSEALARRDWPNEAALGKRVQYQGDVYTIVGVVGDTKTNTLSADARATIYTAFAQRLNGLTLMIRTRDEPTSIVPSLRSALQEVAPAMPIVSAESTQHLIEQSFGEERFRTILIDLFGFIAALLAAVGMYGVTSRAVTRREREVGIRVALGASGASVTRMIVASTLAGVAAGVAIGGLASIETAQLLSPYLFGVRFYDPATYLGILGLLAAVSVGASWAPARRASRVAPAIVLRGE